MNSKHSLHGVVTDDDTILSGATSSIGTSNAGLPDVLYLKEPGSAMAVSMGDINQGWALGDCFLLSAMGEIARQSVIQNRPDFIPSLIRSFADGTENVALHVSDNSGKWGVANIHVTNDFAPGSVNSGANQATYGGKQEIWPQIIEKAAGGAMGGYPNSIANGGYTYAAMQLLSGQAATVVGTASATLANMMAWSGNNDLISFDTGQAAAGYGLVSNHSYGFAGYSGTGAGTAIKLQNPWGNAYDPPPIPLAAIASGATGIIQIDVGHFNLGAGHGTMLG